MNSKSAVRQSNLELLRVLAIILVIIHHIIVHVVYDQINYADSISILGNPYFCKPVFFPQLWLMDIGTFFGSMADLLFILISGYFLVEKNNISVSKTIIKLLTQGLFAACVFTVFNFLYHFFGFSYSDIYLAAREESVSWLRFEFFNESFWFIGFYFMIFLLGAIFLNGFLDKLEKKQYIEFLLILFAVIEFSYTRQLLDSISSYIQTFVIGVFVYSLGGYIKKYDCLRKIRSFVLILLLILTLAVSCFITSYCRVLDIESYIRSGSQGGYFQQIYVFNFHNVLVIANIVLLFELFKRIKIKNNKVINYLGASVFITYLIHDNELFYRIWYKYDWCTALYSDVNAFICNIITVSILTFGIGIVMYSIYKLLYKGLKIILNNEE